jgi:hypothetical protein
VRLPFTAGDHQTAGSSVPPDGRDRSQGTPFVVARPLPGLPDLPVFQPVGTATFRSSLSRMSTDRQRPARDGEGSYRACLQDSISAGRDIAASAPAEAERAREVKSVANPYIFIAICSTKIKVQQNKIPCSTPVKLASLFEGLKNHLNIESLGGNG